MNRKKIALILIVVIAVASFGVVYFFVLGVSTNFQRTRAVPDVLLPRYSISILGLENCIVDIGVIDDPALLYSLSIELDRPGRADTTPETSLLGITEDFVFYEYDDRDDYYALHISQNVNANAKIKAVNLTLGNEVPFAISIGGEEDVQVNVLYNNEVPFDYINFICGGDVDLDLTITEDVVYSGNGLDLVIDVVTLNLDVDLPTGVSGRLTMTSPDYQVTTYGWYTTWVEDDDRHYESDDDPLTPKMLDGSIIADEIIAVLTD